MAGALAKEYGFSASAAAEADAEDEDEEAPAAPDVRRRAPVRVPAPRLVPLLLPCVGEPPDEPEPEEAVADVTVTAINSACSVSESSERPPPPLEADATMPA